MRVDMLLGCEKILKDIVFSMVRVSADDSVLIKVQLNC